MRSRRLAAQWWIVPKCQQREGKIDVTPVPRSRTEQRRIEEMLGVPPRLRG
jgi:hypothetical protein